MSSDPAPVPAAPPPAWAAPLAAALRRAGGVEALSIDVSTRRIEAATLGPVDEAALRAELSAVLCAVFEAGELKGEPAGPVSGVRFSRRDGRLVVEKPACDTAPRLWRWREIPWPGCVSGVCDSAHDHGDEDHDHEGHDHEDEDWRVLAAFAGVCALFIAAGYAVAHFFGENNPYAVACFVLALVAGGWDAFKDSLENLPKGRLDIHFLMLLVAVGACAIGKWVEGATLLFLFSGSGALEHYAMHRTKKAIDALFKVAPKTARVLDAAGVETDTPVEIVKVGDRVAVKPGDTFPLDGEVADGETAADESTLTGEARPVTKALGDPVYGGTQNLWGAVRVRVTKPASESSLQKIIRLIRDAQRRKAPAQRFTDRFGTAYSVAILVITALAFLWWWLIAGRGAFAATAVGESAFYRAMTLLVVASPCALVLSIPSAILAAIAWGARHGILFRGGAAIEKLAEIDCVCLDKTGTLTTGELTVERTESFPAGREADILRMAVALEAHSTHPLARAIVAHGRRKGVAVAEVSDFRSMTGMGVRGAVNGVSCALGRREMLGVGALGEWTDRLPEPSADHAEVWVVAEGVIGRILLRDEIRRESKPVMDALAALKIRTVMLTGDRSEAAAEVGRKLGLAEVQSGLKPEGKVEYVRALSRSGHKVAMVGDGVNDSPALAAADIAVAMGARGSDAALEQSDLVLMDDRIELFLDARRLSVRSRRVIRQNLAISLATIVVMAGLSLFTASGIPLYIGVFAHEGSTVLVCLNSMRLLLGKGGRA